MKIYTETTIFAGSQNNCCQQIETGFRHISPNDSEIIRQTQRLGATGRTNKVIRIMQENKNIEEKFMNFAYKVGRSEMQRNTRAAKR